MDICPIESYIHQHWSPQLRGDLALRSFGTNVQRTGGERPLFDKPEGRTWQGVLNVLDDKKLKLSVCLL